MNQNITKEKETLEFKKREKQLKEKTQNDLEM